MPNIQDILPIVKGAVNRLCRELEQSVIEFPHIEREDWWGYAREVAFLLVEGKCQCGRANCVREHSLAQYSPQRGALSSFIYRAVIGPYGLRPNSVQQGMLFPILHEEHRLLVVKVGFKQCITPLCGNLYEGTTCTRCGHPFAQATTPVTARDWLTIEGVYTTEGSHWWACGAGRKAHYYIQRYCIEIPDDNPDTYPEPSSRLHHDSQEHDRCPLLNCPRCGQEHGERGTTLWQRASFEGTQQTSHQRLEPFEQSVIEGLREAMASLQDWQHAWISFLAREDIEDSLLEERWKVLLQKASQLADSELLTIADRLFYGREKGSLSRSKALEQLTAHTAEIAKALGLADLRFPRRVKEVADFEESLKQQVREKSLRALQKKGIREKELQAWLRRERSRAMGGQ